MSIRCGHCKNDHETIAEVKRCAGVGDTPGIWRPKEGNPARATWSMPEGYYAIDGRDGRPTDFYLVQRPDTGKWKGWTFLKMVVGGKSDVSIRKWDLIWPILEAIQENPTAAAVRYGLELGRCGKCNSHLTNAMSRERGIGPDCWEKYFGGMAA